MGFRMWQRAGIAALAAAGLGAAARDDATTGPSDPKAKVRAAIHESPFAAYPYGVEDKTASWKESNELVRKLGGWKAFAADQVPDVPAASAGGAGKAAGAPAPKGGHADHGKR